MNILCLLGWHDWTRKSEPVPVGNIGGFDETVHVKALAICDRCGAKSMQTVFSHSITHMPSEVQSEEAWIKELSEDIVEEETA